MMRSQLRIPTRLADRNRPLPPRFGSEPPPPPPTREEITPSSEWTEDSNFHYLLIQLPDFKQEEIKMQIQGGPDRFNISGERKAAAENIIFFDKTYTVPEDINADLEKSSFKFNAGTFTVTIPKRLPPPPPSPVQQHVQDTLPSENDTNLSSDIGDLETASDGEDEAQHQKKRADYLKKEIDDGEDEKKLKENQHQITTDQEEEEEEKLQHEEEQHNQYQQQNENKTTHSVEEEEEEEEEEETQKRGSWNEKNQFNSAAQMICKSKNTIFISFIAFCLGVLVSRKMGH